MVLKSKARLVPGLGFLPDLIVAAVSRVVERRPGAEAPFFSGFFVGLKPHA